MRVLKQPGPKQNFKPNLFNEPMGSKNIPSQNFINEHHILIFQRDRFSCCFSTCYPTFPSLIRHVRNIDIVAFIIFFEVLLTCFIDCTRSIVAVALRHVWKVDETRFKVRDLGRLLLNSDRIFEPIKTSATQLTIRNLDFISFAGIWTQAPWSLGGCLILILLLLLMIIYQVTMENSIQCGFARVEETRPSDWYEIRKNTPRR